MGHNTYLRHLDQRESTNTAEPPSAQRVHVAWHHPVPCCAYPIEQDRTASGHLGSMFDAAANTTMQTPTIGC